MNKFQLETERYIAELKFDNEIIRRENTLLFIILSVLFVGLFIAVVFGVLIR